MKFSPDMLVAVCVTGLAIGLIVGYALRSFVSHRRRLRAERARLLY